MKKWLLCVLALMLCACGSTGGAAPQGSLQINKIDVRIAESFPIQVFANVQGTLSDGCASLGAIEQKREGNTVIVTIGVKHTGAEVCTQVAPLVDENIRLEGEFPSGQYTLRVNGVEHAFQV